MVILLLLLLGILLDNTECKLSLISSYGTRISLSSALSCYGGPSEGSCLRMKSLVVLGMIHMNVIVATGQVWIQLSTSL